MGIIGQYHDGQSLTLQILLIFRSRKFHFFRTQFASKTVKLGAINQQKYSEKETLIKYQIKSSKMYSISTRLKLIA